MNKPEWANDHFPTYSEVVDSFGYEVIDCKSWGDWQGDYTYILKDGDRIGYLVIGYGSCSGCDALQDAIPCWGSCGEPCECDWSRLVLLRDSLLDDIHWEAPEKKEYKNDWWDYEPQMNEWLVSKYSMALDGEQ